MNDKIKEYIGGVIDGLMYGLTMLISYAAGITLIKAVDIVYGKIKLGEPKHRSRNVTLKETYLGIVGVTHIRREAPPKPPVQPK